MPIPLEFARRIWEGLATLNIRPLRVWLIEYQNPFSAPPMQITDAEVTRVREEIRTRLDGWFTQVVQHAQARSSRPSGYEDRVEVQWTDRLTTEQVGDRGLVIYFCPLDRSDPPTRTVLHGEYQQAARSTGDRAFIRSIEDAAAEPLGAAGSHLGGSTLAFPRALPYGGWACFPILCEVYVKYQVMRDGLVFPDSDQRADANAAEGAANAFHEAMHNKSTAVSANIDIHGNDGGGGIAAPVRRVLEPTAENIERMAEWIWAWAPQYLLGQTLQFVNDPARPSRPPAPRTTR